MKNPFKDLNKFELSLWLVSLAVVTLSFLIPRNKDYLTLIASLIGVTALIFVAKGYVLGQILTVVFALFYGFVSLHLRYYGEMITYLGMSAPMAILAAVEWIRHPYKNTKVVQIHKITKKQAILLAILTVIVTVVFYFVLDALNTANLIFSTISVATSFIASFLTYLKSPYYAIGYSLNDIVLIILWVLASVQNAAYIPMVICFVMFLANDIYGFVNWCKMANKQRNI
ncbi:MAG: nicotinamide mononucleotide transporter [Clostridia bacterium]|nr:nicotinamide mononucleotide transporter [Clostridia bacterium]